MTSGARPRRLALGDGGDHARGQASGTKRLTQPLDLRLSSQRPLPPPLTLQTLSRRPAPPPLHVGGQATDDRFLDHHEVISEGETGPRSGDPTHGAAKNSRVLSRLGGENHRMLNIL